MSQSWYKGSEGSEYLYKRTVATSSRNQILRSTIFVDLQTKGKTVLDFGCGTGEILCLLPCQERIGVEIGERAGEIARSNGVKVFLDLSEIKTNSIDVVISFHALEHVDCPIDILHELYRVLRPGGKVRIVVPCETPFHRRERSWTVNHDRHLYTWTPLLIGNLAMRVNFSNIKSYIRSMPTAGRFGKVVGMKTKLGRGLHIAHSFWHGRLNTVLDATKPLEG